MARTPLTLLLALTLAACAGLQRVDNTVQSYARWDRPDGATASAPQAPQRYRFERLPSQQDGTLHESQERLEALTRTLLAARGWAQAETGRDARWTVQVTASTVRAARDPWGDPWWGGWHFRGHIVAGNGGIYFAPMLGFPVNPPSSSYQRQVTLLIREVASGRVVYETRADHESRWNSAPALWQAMLEAALRDFPAPPDGPRQVVIELPR